MLLLPNICSASITFFPLESQFNATHTTGKIGYLIITEDLSPGFTISIESNDINGFNEFDFDSVNGVEVPYTLACHASENLGTNTYLDMHSNDDIATINNHDENNICLQTETYAESPNNLKIDIYLNIIANHLFLYDPEGYKGETLKININTIN